MMLGEYLALRQRVINAGYAEEIEWAETVLPPETTEDFAQEAIWVICCSGFKEQRARVTQAAVTKALADGKSATTVFPKSGKGRAIDELWSKREERFAAFRGQFERMASDADIVSWIATLPYVGGPILRWHFAKNLGLNVAKPDRWLLRVAADSEREETPTELCARLGRATGERIATIDLVIWRARNLGFWAPRAAQ